MTTEEKAAKIIEDVRFIIFKKNKISKKYDIIEWKNMKKKLFLIFILSLLNLLFADEMQLETYKINSSI